MCHMRKIVSELETKVAVVDAGDPCPSAIQKEMFKVALRHSCSIYSTHCPVHGFIHGMEAEELRAGIERIIATEGDQRGFRRCLQELLDKVDARDSLAYCEQRDKEQEEG